MSLLDSLYQTALANKISKENENTTAKDKEYYAILNNLSNNLKGDYGVGTTQMSGAKGAEVPNTDPLAWTTTPQFTAQFETGEPAGTAKPGFFGKLGGGLIDTAVNLIPVVGTVGQNISRAGSNNTVGQNIINGLYSFMNSPGSENVTVDTSGLLDAINSGGGTVNPDGTITYNGVTYTASEFAQAYATAGELGIPVGNLLSNNSGNNGTEGMSNAELSALVDAMSEGYFSGAGEGGSSGGGGSEGAGMMAGEGGGGGSMFGP